MAPSPAALAKEKGNAAFAAADYPAAVGHYTAAILADTSDPTFPLNRAAAYLKLDKHQDAERDCTRVLALSPTNVKALFRRAQARVALSLLDPARQDLQNALALQPTNAAVAAELTRVDALAAQERAKAKAKTQPKDISPPSSTSAPPPTTQPPKPKRRRIPITIVEPEPEPASASTSASSAPTPTPAPPPAPTPTSFKDAKRARDSAKPSVVAPAAPPASTTHARPNAPADSSPAPRARGGVFRASGEHTLFPASPPAAASPSAPRVLATPARTAPVPVPASANMTTRAKPPTTLFAFTRAWEREADAAARWALLCQIPPPALPALFQTSLEPALLTSLLTTFLALLSPPPSPSPSANDDDDAAPALRRHIRAYMAGLARTPRFATAVLLMSRAERARVAAVWAALRATDIQHDHQGDGDGDGDGDGALLEEEARRWGV